MSPHQQDSHQDGDDDGDDDDDDDDSEDDYHDIGASASLAVQFLSLNETQLVSLDIFIWISGVRTI